MRHNFIGIVISTAMDKTVRVQVAKRVMVHRFQKEVLRHKVYMAHDEMENCNNGDVVRIEHCRKLSRHKSFAVAEVIKPARSWTDPETGIAARHIAARSFSVATATKKGKHASLTTHAAILTANLLTCYLLLDILQDMYLREIRNYKPDAKAAQADVTTKEFAAPKVPAPPQNDINLESDMKTYEQTGTLGQ
ncbi:hypothetical protein LPJ54_000692 [Coemansia sp. RSA 1824]|nr:hypothetical protein LPJ54_000692 [Coemansia sp. RSA 1824]